MKDAKIDIREEENLIWSRKNKIKNEFSSIKTNAVDVGSAHGEINVCTGKNKISGIKNNAGDIEGAHGGTNVCTGIKGNSGADKNTGEKISVIKKDTGDEQSIHGEINVDTAKIQRILSEMYELMKMWKNWDHEGKRSPCKRLE